MSAATEVFRGFLQSHQANAVSLFLFQSSVCCLLLVCSHFRRRIFIITFMRTSDLSSLFSTCVSLQLFPFYAFFSFFLTSLLHLISISSFSHSTISLYIDLIQLFLYGFILWHIYPLLGNGRETNDETTAIATQRPASNNGSTVACGVFYVVRSEAYITRLTEFGLVSKYSAVEYSAASWLVSDLVRGLLQSSPCAPLLLEAGSWGTEIVRESRVRGTSAVESRYQATTGKDTADRGDVVSGVVNCKVYELAKALQLLIVTFFKLSINPITNSNTVCRYS
jgi:hypothetical protein